jgi:Cdc6-like AAA superfamily ATPase
MGPAQNLHRLTVFCLLAFTLLAEGQQKYRDGRLPLEDRVADLLARMTLEEKVGQMCQKDVSALEIEDDRVTPGSLAHVFVKQSCGTMMCPPGRAFGDLLAELDMYAFLHARVQCRGRYGRTREIQLDLPDQLIAKIHDTILLNFDTAN